MMNEKMTLREKFNEVYKLAEECGREDVMDFATERIALLDKKSASKSSAVNEEHERLMDLICTCLARESEPVTVSELQKHHEEVSVTVYSNQKISSMLKKLVAADRVLKDTLKGVSYFKLA